MAGECDSSGILTRLAFLQGSLRSFPPLAPVGLELDHPGEMRARLVQTSPSRWTSPRL